MYDNNIEIWKWIPGYENLYEVSNMGTIRSWNSRGKYKFKVSKLLKYSLGGCKRYKYPMVTLYNNKISKSFYIHKIVCVTFLGEKPNNLEIRHINNNRFDNRLCNLEYSTHNNNENDKIIFNTRPYGEKSGKSKFTNKDIKYIKELISNGERNIDIAKKFNVHRDTIYRIKYNKTYINKYDFPAKQDNFV